MTTPHNLARRMFTTIDAHAAGEPLRIVTSGVPRLRGSSILEKRRDMLDHHDDARRMLMWEPRGHADMYGAILTEPVTPDGDFGVLFMHNEGYSTMCGHGIIALTTALIETGVVTAGSGSVTLRYDTPAGRVSASAAIDRGRVLSVAFENVPSFVFEPGVHVETRWGLFDVPIVFGGAFYAVIGADAAGLTVEPSNVRELIDLGMAVKHAVEERVRVSHPLETDLSGIYGTIICGRPDPDTDPKPEPARHGRNVTIFADGEVDRSPCGTGTAGRLALMYARGEIGLGQEFVHDSIIGTRFTGRVLRECAVAGFPAIVPEIRGRGFLSGVHTFVIEPDDPVRDGFLVR